MIRTDLIMSFSRKLSHLPLTILLLVFFLGLTGCTALLQPRPSPQTYVLDASIDSPPIDRGGDAVLLVETIRTAAGFDTPYIAYTDTPFALDYYTQSEWADTPARMLLPLVVKAMETSGAFSAVLIPPTTVPGDLRLAIDIIRLQQEFLDRPSRVRLTLRAKLIDMQTNQVLGSEYFEVVETAASENAYGGVQAANRAVKQTLRELVAFVMFRMNHAADNSR